MSELYHHGIQGQQWGVRNGPPYPLYKEDFSAREKRYADWEKKHQEYGEKIREKESENLSKNEFDRDLSYEYGKKLWDQSDVVQKAFSKYDNEFSNRCKDLRNESSKEEFQKFYKNYSYDDFIKKASNGNSNLEALLKDYYANKDPYSDALDDFIHNSPTIKKTYSTYEKELNKYNKLTEEATNSIVSSYKNTPFNKLNDKETEKARDYVKDKVLTMGNGTQLRYIVNHEEMVYDSYEYENLYEYYSHMKR